MDNAVRQVVENRIKPTLAAHPELEMPPMSEVRTVVRDCLIASVTALGAAAMARMTPGYTDEGGEPGSIILGDVGSLSPEWRG